MVQSKGISKKRICRRRSASYWKKTMREFEESSLTIAAFCREKNIAYGTFMGRRQDFKKGAPHGTFIPVKIEDSAKDIQREVISQEEDPSNVLEQNEWVLKVGTTLSLCIPNDFNEVTLKRLVRVLRAC